GAHRQVGGQGTGTGAGSKGLRLDRRKRQAGTAGLSKRGAIGIMADVKHEQSTYLSDFARFEKNGASNGRSGMHQVRKSAMSCFSDLGFPTLRHEEWRFTNVAPIAQRVFALAESGDSVTLEKLRDLNPG